MAGSRSVPRPARAALSRLARRSEPVGQFSECRLLGPGAAQVQRVIAAEKPRVRTGRINDLQHMDEATVGIVSLENLLALQGHLRLTFTPVRAEEARRKQRKEGFRSDDR